jgi:ClpP class serine protease
MSLYRYAHIAARMFNRPLLIHEQKAEIILGALTDRLGITSIVRLNGEIVALQPMAVTEAAAPGENESRSAGGTYRTVGYDVAMGIARIEIEGTLVYKSGDLRPWSGMTGYDGIRENFVRAMNDPGVRAIALEIDSPGGEVKGCFDLADMIYNARGDKPIWAILAEDAFSAAYAIASAADFITVPRTGGTGSIGVVAMHCDFSAAIKKAGIEVTFIKRGARKIDGASELPLSAEALKRFQAEIDICGELFENTVARNRGLSAAKIRDMDASTFLGAEGVTRGLADAVMAPSDAFAALLQELG